jgi:hypothetical protein
VNFTTFGGGVQIATGDHGAHIKKKARAKRANSTGQKRNLDASKTPTKLGLDLYP